ncbi:MAG: UDP-N-acetylmuramoyl-L-alanine--D-glutamate ligase [Bacteroidota bacterium]|nr:UDP-N-acetylmuramoyl-L-alanine--D-glutamate ligase [Bacteroidota bacterium]
MKKIVVIGAGESGFGAAVLAKAKGCDVLVSDNNEIDIKFKAKLKEQHIRYEENGHSEREILKADEIIKSPGVSPAVPIIKRAIDRDIPVISEIEFAGRYTNAKMICITGSNGKTTTTLWAYHILKHAGLNVGLAGNVGSSLAYEVATNQHDYYVIELSSFQLDNMYDFKADIAVLLNITPDHLDRYDFDFNKYINSKFRILQNQNENDVFIYSADDSVIKKELALRNINARKIPFSIRGKIEKPSVHLENKNIMFNIKTPFSMSVENVSLPGSHNTYNSMAAGAIAKVLNIKKENIRESLMGFKNVEHRLEPVIKVHGIEFINDSKATNVNSAWYALESMTKQTVWIVGGIDKGNDYKQMEELVKQKVKAIVCLGKDNRKIHDTFSNMVDKVVDANTMKDAVTAAYYLAKDGDAVLLSPACASFDLFDNYEDRGNQFKAAVRAL